MWKQLQYQAVNITRRENWEMVNTFTVLMTDILLRIKTELY